MPEMQEQFPAIAMDVVYAGNAGAISGDRHGGLSRPSMAFEALGLLPIVCAGNAGAISGNKRLQ